VELPLGCVPYVPCPVSTAQEALHQAAVTCDDVFVDVGSGAGRVALLAHLLTGCGSIGLEIQSGLVRAAQGRADWLNLERVRFVRGDAAKLVRFVPLGTVFFLYCPFGAAHLRGFLDGLEDRARAKQIRVCCVDMPPLTCPWLVRCSATSLRVDVYRSTLHGGATG
jgi:ubiquinone/menaquinone biosynthesis C-methylase UbiE